MFQKLLYFVSTSPQNFYYLTLFPSTKTQYGYSIHGLWPNFADGTYPSFCKDIPFDIDKLQSILPELIRFWELPEDSGKIESSFWEHEWKKHGTCMFLEIDELDYFKKALELYTTLMKNTTDLSKYKKGKSFMIPFDLDFNIMEPKKETGNEK